MNGSPKNETAPLGIMVACFAAASALVLLPQQNWVGQVQMQLVNWTARLPNEWRADQPRSQAFASTVQIVISLNDRTLSLYQSNQHQTTYELAIGQAGWETPTGSFQVEVLQRNPDWTHPITGEYIPPGDRKNPLGTRWIGFFRQGNEEFGIHGTNQEDSIGRAVSHGCLRMRNQDIEALFDQITEGTPVIIRP